MRKNQAAFTLLELVVTFVIIGILASIAVPKIGNLVDQSRINTTKREMSEIQRAIMGDPEAGSLGYRGTVGALPATLANLYTDPGTGFNYYTSKGWNGPYIDSRDVDGVAGVDVLSDAWGIAYVYNSGTGLLTSYGPNKASGGGDDITIMLQ